MQPFPFSPWKKSLLCHRFNATLARAAVLGLGWCLIGNCQAFAAAATTTTMTVTSAGNAITQVTQGAVVTLTATVTAGAGPLTTGQINFCDATVSYCTDIHRIATVQLTSAGPAAFKFRPGPGSHSYKAVFVGTTSYAASTSAASPLSVSPPTKLPTTTAIAQSGDNGSFALTATVGGNGSTAPTGTVSFLDSSNGNAVLATATLGPGTGFGFVNPETLTVGDGSIAEGDFNGDGIPDLVVGTAPISSLSSPAGYLTVLLGNGDGTFKTTAGNPATGIDPYAIAVGDFNRDGNLDLAVANAASNTVTVLLGNGDGTFTPAATSPATGNDPVSIAVADFNGDGILDLAVANATGNTVTILLGNGDGTFTPTGTSPATGLGPDSIVAGDFNGDGILDLATANVSSNNVTILLGDGIGSFTAAASPATGAGPDAIAIGDFNGDGIPDLATANLVNNNIGTVSILLGNGDGTFTPTAASPSTGIDPDSIVVGDFNGDGVADLAVANGVSNTVTVLLGDGHGAFTPSTPLATNGLDPQKLAVADFNGDGLSDLAVENSGSYNGGSTYSGNGMAMLLASTQVATATATGISVGNGPHLVEASYPGDGNYASSISVATNLAGPTEATTLTLNISPSGTAAPGQPVTLTATLTPYTSQNHSTDGETITFYNGSSVLGTGTLSGGVAQLTLTPLPASYSISAAFSGDAYFAAGTSASIPLVVGPATSTTLTLFTSPSGSVVGYQPLTFTAKLNPYTSQGHSTDGELITFYNGTSSLGTGVLSGGTATLTISAGGPGTYYQVTAQYGGDVYFYSSVSEMQGIQVDPQLATTLNLALSPNPVTYGGGVTMTATLNPSSQQGVAATGQVTFTYSNSTGYRAAVEAYLSNGVATTAGGVYGMPAGTYQVQATYPGNDLFAEPAPATATLIVKQVVPTIALASSANPAPFSGPVTFTANLSPITVIPTNGQDNVAFYDGNTQLALEPLSNNAAAYTTSSLPTGSHNITAVYLGDPNYASVTSAVLTETIEGFGFGSSSGGTTTSATAAPGGQASYVLAVDPPAGTTLPAAVTFAVTGLPLGATATFSPPTLPANSGPTNVTMTVTLASQAAATKPRAPFSGGELPMALGMILLPFAGRLRQGVRRRSRIVCLMILGILGSVWMTTLSGCGSSNGGGSNPPPQTYTLTVTATSGSLSQSTTVSLTVE